MSLRVLPGGALLLIFGVVIHAVHSNRAASKEHPKLLVASPLSNSESSSSSEATSLSLRVTEASGSILGG
ncbi:hypothetical protein MRX96_032987 [Rhipicephalus microplus]